MQYLSSSRRTYASKDFLFALPTQCQALLAVFMAKFLRRFNFNSTSKTFFGSLMNCKLRDELGRTVFYYGMWEPSLSYWLSKTLKQKDVFIDVGANIGYYSLLAAKLVGDRGHVISFEPVKGAFDRLNKHLVLNAINNVKCHQLAIGNKVGHLEMNEGPAFNSGQASAKFSFEGSSCAKVPLTTLDQIISEDIRAKIKFIKIDVEGFELEVCEGMKGLLEHLGRETQIVVEVSGIGEACEKNRERIEEIFTSRGFFMYRVPHTYSEKSYIGSKLIDLPIAINKIPNFHCDVLFTKTNLDSVIANTPVIRVSQLMI